MTFFDGTFIFKYCLKIGWKYIKENNDLTCGYEVRICHSEGFCKFEDPHRQDQDFHSTQ